MVSRNNSRNWLGGETGQSVKWVRRSLFESRYGMIFGKRKINESCRTSARRSKIYYVQSSPFNAKLGEVVTACLGKPSCPYFLWEKSYYVTTDAYGPPHSPLKICTFFDIKRLCSTWLTDAAGFYIG